MFFAGKRIAMRNVSSGTIYYYEDDMLGSARTMVQAGQTSVCGVYPERSRRNADFLPYGQEVDYTSSCGSHFKFTGKERDTETGNDDFGARYYTSRLGRWLSADWSSVPAPVPYANLTNPQTLNLYAMVSDNPETFADLDGHCSMDEEVCETGPTIGGPTDPASSGKDVCNSETGKCDQKNTNVNGHDQDQAQQQNSQTTSNSSASSDPIATALSNVPGVASVTPAPDPTRDKAIGGHQNETDALTFKTPEDQAKFLAESSRKHLVPGDVSENGFGPGVRLPGGLHAEQGRLDPRTGQFLVTSHIDRFNANNGLAPLVGHFVVDVFIGTVFFHHTAGLDQ